MRAWSAGSCAGVRRARVCRRVSAFNHRLRMRGRPLPIADMRNAHVIYDCWSVMCIPLADRLNRSPPVWECSLMTTPLSFLR